jgi:hypothetical protein
MTEQTHAATIERLRATTARLRAMLDEQEEHRTYVTRDREARRRRRSFYVVAGGRDVVAETDN